MVDLIAVCTVAWWSKLKPSLHLVEVQALLDATGCVVEIDRSAIVYTPGKVHKLVAEGRLLPVNTCLSKPPTTH